MSEKNGVTTKTPKKRRRGRPTLAASIDTEQILRAALISFAEFGFGGAKITNIAKRAKVDDSLLHLEKSSRIRLSRL